MICAAQVKVENLKKKAAVLIEQLFWMEKINDKFVTRAEPLTRGFSTESPWTSPIVSRFSKMFTASVEFITGVR